MEQMAFLEQTAFIEKAIVLFVYLATIGGTIYTISRQRRKDREKALSEFAKKTDVNKDFKAMEKRIDVVEAITERNRKENIEAHREIKEEIKETINTRFDDLKELIKTIKNSA